MKQLLTFRGFLHDPQCVLATVYRLTFVGIELPLNVRLGISTVRVSGKLCVATLTDSERRNIPNSLYDPKVATGHDSSLAHLAGSA
jgi:hypothetical protein